jgi:hypothetical protein
MENYDHIVNFHHHGITPSGVRGSQVLMVYQSHSRVRRDQAGERASATVRWPDVWRRSPSLATPHRLCELTSSYWGSSWWSASLATPETVPVNSPAAAKKTGLFMASAKTGDTVSVNERTPDAFLKRPVPPVI